MLKSLKRHREVTIPPERVRKKRRTGKNVESGGQEEAGNDGQVEAENGSQEEVDDEEETGEEEEVENVDEEVENNEVENVGQEEVENSYEEESYEEKGAEEVEVENYDKEDVENGYEDVQNGYEDVQNGYEDVENGSEEEVENGGEEVENGEEEVENGEGEVDTVDEEVENGEEEENGGEAELLPRANNGTSTTTQTAVVVVPVLRHVKSQPTTVTCSIIKDDDKATKFYTGLSSWKVFKLILTFLETTCPSGKPIKSDKMQPADCLMLVLMRLRLNLFNEDLAYRFGISLSRTSDIIQRWIDVMFTSLKCLIVWPSKEAVYANMPQVFKELFPHTRCIIDCSEVFIERPYSYKARAQTFSNYKKHNTVKFLIGITPNGAISFLSQCWDGRATDKFITHHSGFLRKIEHGDVILADRGFDITDDLCIYGAHLEIPSFTRGKKQLSMKEVEHSKKIAKVRIHVERVIGVLKNRYIILQNTLPISLLRHKNDSDYSNIDQILTVCAALINTSNSVVPL